MTENPQTALARRYVEQTGVSVFLTGKAGTGKTTFLRDLVANTTKRHAVVAPTGVAAINAGGVTIHSFFQLPFDPYLPDVKELVTEYQMSKRHKSLSKTKLNIIRTLELLIIDEISMVRADLLDAIDMTLRRVRRSSRPFGGVQLLMIGDVHQLAPVVTEEERPFMERVYPTPYFFASKALQQIPYVTIELTTVYRQQDTAFVNLLNRVRNNQLDDVTLRTLNSRVGTHQKDAITLTTHNRQADAINRRHFNALRGELRTFNAVITGNYPEKAYPCDCQLEVKVGERVMFVKNDSSGAHRYYNGMLATVTGFKTNDDKEYIEVIDDEGDVVITGHERWENMRYTLDDENGNITQEIDGTFSQFPLQAAWAVTIHKAQGLTFDRVVIDAADAFAFGQVYVALSRCRTLEGLSLSTPIGTGVAFNDTSVSQYIDSRPSFDDTSAAADGYEQQYRLEKLMELFAVDDLVHLAERLAEHYNKLKNLYPDNVERMKQVVLSLETLQGVSERFKLQLMRLDEQHQNERAAKGAEHYRQQLSAARNCYQVLLDIKIDNKENSKNIKELGDSIKETLDLKLACLEAVAKKGYSVATVQQAKASHLLNNADKDSQRESHKKKSADSGEWQADSGDLETILRRWRSAKSKELGVPVYMVLQQKALMAIVAHRPSTPAELKKMNGVGQRTLERYGQELLDLVAGYIG